MHADSCWICYPNLFTSFSPFSKKWCINELKVLSCDHLPHCPVQLAPAELRNSRLARQLGSVFGTWTQLLWKRFVYTNSVRSFGFSLQLQAHLFCNHLPSCTDIRKRRACSFTFLEEHKSSSMCFFLLSQFVIYPLPKEVWGEKTQSLFEEQF